MKETYIDAQLAEIILEIALHAIKVQDTGISFPASDYVTKIKAICLQK